MQIVIEIDEKIYRECQGNVYLPDTGEKVWDAIRHGTPLPEHRMASAEKVGEPVDVIHTKEYGDIVICSQDQFEYLPPTSLRETVRLIEADNAESEGKE